MGCSPTRSWPRGSWTAWSTAPTTCSCRARATAPTSARAPTRPTRHKEVAQARTAPVGVSDSLIDPLMNSLIVHRPPGQRHRAGSWSATAAGSGSPRAAPYRCRPRTGEVALMGEYARTVAAGSRTTTGVRRPTTSHRTKQPTPAGKAEQALLGALGRPGQDRRSAAEYAADLARETEVSLRRDPTRWRTRRTIEVPKDRSSSPGGTP